MRKFEKVSGLVLFLIGFALCIIGDARGELSMVVFGSTSILIGYISVIVAEMKKGITVQIGHEINLDDIFGDDDDPFADEEDNLCTGCHGCDDLTKIELTPMENMLKRMYEPKIRADLEKDSFFIQSVEKAKEDRLVERITKRMQEILRDRPIFKTQPVTTDQVLTEEKMREAMEKVTGGSKSWEAKDYPDRLPKTVAFDMGFGQAIPVPKDGGIFIMGRQNGKTIFNKALLLCSVSNQIMECIAGGKPIHQEFISDYNTYLSEVNREKGDTRMPGAVDIVEKHRQVQMNRENIERCLKAGKHPISPMVFEGYNQSVIELNKLEGSKEK